MTIKFFDTRLSRNVAVRNKMNNHCDEYATDIVSLKRPTALDKLADSIPKPKGAVPNFGLPKWKVMPLESKIPMVPGPAGAYNFTRRKIGKDLWISAPNAEFNLSDPYCYEIRWTYDSLHDKHLLPYFSRPNNLQHLIKSGFITKNLDAKCSLRDYNMYRRYLRKLHCDSIKNELNRRTKQSIEERAIQYAEEQAKKEVRKLKERERLMETKRAVMRERERADRLRRKRQKEKQRQIEERLKTLREKKKEEQEMRQIQSQAQAELIRQKQRAAAERHREKMTQTMLEWRRKERKRKLQMELRLAREQEKKRQTVEQKWAERLEFQKRQIEKEQFLLKCIEGHRKAFIEGYNEKVNKETERMKKLFEDMKMFISCYLARRGPGSKERICCHKYYDDDSEETSVPDRKGGKRRSVSRRDEKKAKKMKRQSDVQRRRTSEKRLMKGREKHVLRRRRRKLRKSEGGSKGRVTKRRSRRRKKKSRKEKESVSQIQSELETVSESVQSLKTEASEKSVASVEDDACRCQIIRDAHKAALDQQ